MVVVCQTYPAWCKIPQDDIDLGGGNMSCLSDEETSRTGWLWLLFEVTLLARGVSICQMTMILLFSDISRHVQFSSIYVYSIALTEHKYRSKAAFKK